MPKPYAFGFRFIDYNMKTTACDFLHDVVAIQGITCSLADCPSTEQYWTHRMMEPCSDYSYPSDGRVANNSTWTTLVCVCKRNG